jgi:multisubunit Na+/H+ antiporter MnhF subunit
MVERDSRALNLATIVATVQRRGPDVKDTVIAVDTIVSLAIYRISLLVSRNLPASHLPSAWLLRNDVVGRRGTNNRLPLIS